MSPPEVQLKRRSSEPEEVQTHASLCTACHSVRSAEIFRMKCGEIAQLQDAVSVEEPLEIQFVYGAADDCKVKSISITMRTPGSDDEIAAGFLPTKGVVPDAVHINPISTPSAAETASLSGADAGKVAPPAGLRSRAIRVELSPEFEVSMSTFERHSYTTSSCGACGKAYLLALGTLSPLPQRDKFKIRSDALSALCQKLHLVQAAFKKTGGLHAASLFTSDGELHSIREDIGRHNAVNKLLGEAFLQDAVPLRSHLVLLSGQASFELLQKAVMGGIPVVAAIGAPSSLAIEVARELFITIGRFLRPESFNIYSAPNCVLGPNATPYHC